MFACKRIVWLWVKHTLKITKTSVLTCSVARLWMFRCGSISLSLLLRLQSCEVLTTYLSALQVLLFWADVAPVSSTFDHGSQALISTVSSACHSGHHADAAEVIVRPEEQNMQKLVGGWTTPTTVNQPAILNTRENLKCLRPPIGEYLRNLWCFELINYTTVVARIKADVQAIHKESFLKLINVETNCVCFFCTLICDEAKCKMNNSW